MKYRHESIDYEPALNGSQGELTPADRTADPCSGPTSDLDRLRDSVHIEPALPQHDDTLQWTTWLETRRASCRSVANLAITLIAGLCGGLFAVVAAIFFVDGSGYGTLVYACVIAPVAEEILKLSGMIYLLEKQPYRINWAVQIIICAIIAGLTFACIENLVYWIRLNAASRADINEIMALRWKYCMPLHVTCCIIASLGLIRAWRLHLKKQRPVQLADAFNWFLVAMLLHGAYNVAATLLGPK